MGKKLTFEYVCNFVKGKGKDTLLSIKYINSQEKLDFLCGKCKNIFSMSFNNYSNGKGCKYCRTIKIANDCRLNFEDVKELISYFGCELLSKLYVKNTVPLDIKCSCGKVFRKSWISFKESPRCDDCVSKLRRKSQKRFSMDEIREIVENAGCELLSTEYINNSQKLDIRCKCGNIYHPNFNSFKSKKMYQCPTCSTLERSSKRKYSQTFIEQQFAIKGYKVLSDYVKNNVKLELVDGVGYKYLFAYSRFLGGGLPDKFAKHNPHTIENIKLYLKLENKKFLYVSGEFSNAQKKNLFFVCNICDCEWDTSWNMISNGHGCPYCKGKRVSSKNNIAIVRPDLVYEWDWERNISKPTDFTKGSKEVVWWKCGYCNERWESSILSRYSGNGCPFCNMSAGEKKILYWLKHENYDFRYQHIFPKLYSQRGGVLRFDFVVFNEGRPIKIIEYDDVQHDKFIPFFHGVYENFENYKNNDVIKDNYARQNGIDMLRIKSKDFKNIEKILTNNL